MKHLGDISKINGAEIEPVDIITFGSPCQDLSVAGKRAGLEGARSGLFMEAVRIIKEMREATDGKYPRFALWENVPGAFSSNKGEDFRIVLEELIKIVEEEAVMPQVPETGWAYADTYSGDGWSLAYRTFDAQHWGVPQRRRRIYLVADFAGECAGKILFERDGLRGYFAAGRTSGERTTSDVEGGFGTDDREGTAGKSASESEIASTLYAAYGTKWNGNAGAYNGENFVLEPIGVDGYNSDLTGEKASTLGVNCGIATGRNGVIIPFAQNQRDEVRDLGDKVGALQAQPGMKQQTFIIDSIGGQAECAKETEVVPTLKASHYKFPPVVTQSAGFCTEHSEQSRSVGYEDERSPTLRAGVVPAAMYCYDARGNGEGEIVPTITGDHNGHISDYTAVLCMATQQGGAEIMEEKCPTITAAAGMSGNNQPVVVAPTVYDGANITSPINASNTQPGDPCHTLSTDSRNIVCIPIQDQATRFSGKRGEKSDGKGNGLGVGDAGDPMNTLTSGDRHAVCYASAWDGSDISPTLTANNAGGSQRMPDKDNFNCVISVDRAFFNQGKNAQYDPQYYADGTCPTLVAKGPSAVSYKYIVRRLTPTECARLQGFPDKWGHPEQKSDFSNDEYMFWLDVRNTHAEINGKNVKEYTKDQILKWYNKLHSDSAEYKMWGNGIALPPSLYCMQGMAEALTHKNMN